MKKPKQKIKRRRWYHYAAQIFGGIVLALAIGLIFLWLWVGGAKTPPDQQAWGLTYSDVITRELGLDLHKTYQAILDLHPKRLRLVAYWDEIGKTQGKLDFSALDYQVAEAEKRGIPYILTVGRRVPRYPECFAPDWVKKLSVDEQQNELLGYMQKVVDRYDAKPHLITWQVENEAFLSVFGDCPNLDQAFLKREIMLVRGHTRHPIMTTDSGELSLGLDASKLSDIFGTTLYRTVLDKSDRVITYPFPAELYTRRANLIQKLNPNIHKVIIAELQAEPWGNKPLTAYDQAFYDKTMSHSDFDAVISYAKRTGMAEVYMWGAEWWYYQKVHGDSYYWDQAQSAFRTSAY